MLKKLFFLVALLAGLAATAQAAPPTPLRVGIAARVFT